MMVRSTSQSSPNVRIQQAPLGPPAGSSMYFAQGGAPPGPNMTSPAQMQQHLQQQQPRMQVAGAPVSQASAVSDMQIQQQQQQAAAAGQYSVQQQHSMQQHMQQQMAAAAAAGRQPIQPQQQPQPQRPTGVAALPLRSVSPADAVVHRCGRLKDGRIEQVKGIDYDVDEFLGQLSARDDNNNEVSVPRPPSTNRMYYCTLYLAPGDYHAFHSPADWTPIFRRHFPGLLLSVRSALLERIPKLFCLNERVCLLGKWRHGFFSMTAVAATNVGNMQLEMDPTLHTNVSGANLHSHNDRVLDKPDAQKLERGAKVGKFKLGSTIVLVFEAPEKFRFCAAAGDRLNFGQSLGFVVPDDAPP